MCRAIHAQKRLMCRKSRDERPFILQALKTDPPFPPYYCTSIKRRKIKTNTTGDRASRYRRNRRTNGVVNGLKEGEKGTACTGTQRATLMMITGRNARCLKKRGGLLWSHIHVFSLNLRWGRGRASDHTRVRTVTHLSLIHI